MIEAIRSELRAVETFTEAEKLLGQFPPHEGFLTQLSDSLIDAIHSAESLGRSLIVEKDRIESRSEEIAGKWFLCDDKVVRVSFDLVPKEALEYIRYKAMTIAGIEQGQALEAVKKSLIRAISGGKTLKEFRAAVDEVFDSYGITRLSSNHINTVYRTNLYTAYAVGEQAQVEGMRDRFPLWRYSAIIDSQTRPKHRELNGQIFRTGEGPVPPIDYNCRCTAIYLHVTEVKRLGLWDQIENWTGDRDVQRFDTRGSFEDWRQSNITNVSQAIINWINQQL